MNEEWQTPVPRSKDVLYIVFHDAVIHVLCAVTLVLRLILKCKCIRKISVCKIYAHTYYFSWYYTEQNHAIYTEIRIYCTDGHHKLLAVQVPKVQFYKMAATPANFPTCRICVKFFWRTKEIYWTIFSENQYFQRNSF